MLTADRRNDCSPGSGWEGYCAVQNTNNPPRLNWVAQSLEVAVEDRRCAYRKDAEVDMAVVLNAHPVSLIDARAEVLD